MTDLIPCAVLFCAGHEHMRSFYREVMGLAALEEHDDHSVLDAGGLRLVIHPLPGVMSLPDPSQPVPRRRNVAIKLMLPVPSIAEARARADEHGGQIDPPDAEWNWQHRRCCMGQDPEGNVFEVFEPL